MMEYAGSGFDGTCSGLWRDAADFIALGAVIMGGTFFTASFLGVGFLAEASLAASLFITPFLGAAFFLRTAFFFMARD